MNILIGLKEDQIFQEKFLNKLYQLSKHPQINTINIIIDTLQLQLSQRIKLLSFLYTFMNIFVNDYTTITNVYFQDLINFQEFKKQYENKLLRKIQYEEQQDYKLGLQTCELNGYIDTENIQKFLNDFKKVNFEYENNINSFIAGALGGTFNFLHNGHKLLLSLGALNCNKKLIVGVTNDNMIKKKVQSFFIETDKTRQKNVQNFLNIFDKKLEVEILDLQNPMQGWDLDYEVLIVSEETQKSIDIFNNKRKENGIKQIKGCVLKLIEQNGSKFGSTQMRQHLESSIKKEKMQLCKEKITKYLNANDECFYLAENLYFQLLFFYSQKHRVYHNIDHILNVLDQIKKITDLEEKDLNIVILSIFFHDIIHHPCQKNNEVLSADFFEIKAKELGTLDESIIQRIGKIIRSTEKHSYCETDQLQNIINDLDMSILGQEPQKYNKYVKLIKKEYCMIDQFEQKRSQFLQGILDQDKGPFHCEYFSNEQAHKNMQNELEQYNQFIFKYESRELNYIKVNERFVRIRILIIKQNNLALIDK